MQDCSNSSTLAMELLQSCTTPSVWYSWYSSKLYPYHCDNRMLVSMLAMSPWWLEVKSTNKNTKRNTPRIRLLTLCAENPPVTGGFPIQRSRNTRFDVLYVTGIINFWIISRVDTKLGYLNILGRHVDAFAWCWVWYIRMRFQSEVPKRAARFT